MQKTVAVLFGGRSNEREISVITGLLAVNLLRGANFRVIPVFLKPDGGMVTGEFRNPKEFARGAKRKEVPVRPESGGLACGRRKRIPLDCVLNCCHGGAGEDGTMSAIWHYCGVPFASPDTAVSAIFMDKNLSKIAARGLGIPTARGFAAREETPFGEIAEQAEALGYPVVVKPAKLGSSIGIRVARDSDALEDALTFAFRLDGSVLVEEYFGGRRDVNCAAYRKGNEIVLSPLEEVFSDSEILTFSEKYEQRGSRRSQLPADLGEETAEKIRAYTRLLMQAFDVHGVVRADFFVVGEEVYFNELNTVPGSLACYLFAKNLTGSRDFLASLVEEAMEAPREEKEILSSGILEGEIFAGKKGGLR